MTTRFELDPNGVVAIATSTEMVEMLSGIGLAVAETVRQIGEGFASSPPSTSTLEYGHYYENISVEAGVFFGVGQVKVIAGKFTSQAVEFGDWEIPSYHPLRSAADASGLRFEAMQ